jgi:hypothetical protein
MYIHYIYTQYTLYLATLWHSVKQAIYITLYTLWHSLKHSLYTLITLYTFLTIYTDNIRIYIYNTQHTAYTLYILWHSLTRSLGIYTPHTILTIHCLLWICYIGCRIYTIYPTCMSIVYRLHIRNTYNLFCIYTHYIHNRHKV